MQLRRKSVDGLSLFPPPPSNDNSNDNDANKNDLMMISFEDTLADDEFPRTILDNNNCDTDSSSLVDHQRTLLPKHNQSHQHPHAMNSWFNNALFQAVKKKRTASSNRSDTGFAEPLHDRSFRKSDELSSEEEEEEEDHVRDQQVGAAQVQQTQQKSSSPLRILGMAPSERESSERRKKQLRFVKSGAYGPEQLFPEDQQLQEASSSLQKNHQYFVNANNDPIAPLAYRPKPVSASASSSSLVLLASDDDDDEDANSRKQQDEARADGQDSVGLEDDDDDVEVRPVDVHVVTGILQAAHQKEQRLQRQQARNSKRRMQSKRRRKRKAAMIPDGTHPTQQQETPQKSQFQTTNSSWTKIKRNLDAKRQQLHRRQTSGSSVSAFSLPRGVRKKKSSAASDAITTTALSPTAATTTAFKAVHSKAQQQTTETTLTTTTNPTATTTTTTTSVSSPLKRQTSRSFRNLLCYVTGSATMNDDEANSIVKSVSETSAEVPQRTRKSSKKSKKTKKQSETKQQVLTKQQQVLTKQRSWTKRLPSFENGLFRRSKRKGMKGATAANKKVEDGTKRNTDKTRDSSTVKSSGESASSAQSSQNDDSNHSNNSSNLDPGIAGMIARAFGGDPWEEEDSIAEYTDESGRPSRFFRLRGDDISYSSSEIDDYDLDDDDDDFASDLRSAMDDFLDSSCTCCTPGKPNTLR